jgi:hypothetical protein
MRIHNLLEPFVQCLKRWESAPSLTELQDGYFKHLEPWVQGAFFVDEARGFHEAAHDLNWAEYRAETLSLDPEREEARVRKHLRDVEALFGFKLRGEIILFGAFAMMDGYARFDRGTHRVFLGVDESHGRGAYLDVLETHELVHVARESRTEVWEGWGLDPLMSQQEFWNRQPVIEHVFGEGLSCAVSELLVPGEPEWHYAYQTRESLEQALLKGPAIDRRIKEEIAKPHDQSDYSCLYSSRQYSTRVPPYSHYVWGWQLAKRLLRERAGGDPRKLISVCSKEFMDTALAFELKGLEPPLAAPDRLG